MSESCLFCKIVAGEIPAIKLYEDEKVICFMDIFPASEGHCLIVPKVHSEHLLDADPDTIAHVARISVPLANAVKAAVGADGIRVMQSSGKAAAQTVPHYHMHIIPAFEGKAVQQHGGAQADPETLLPIAENIRSLLVM